jgi:hypothetical protein
MSKHNLFNEIENPALRTWNRAAIMFNLLEDVGPEEAKIYANMLDDKARLQVYAMCQYIKAKGYENVRAEVMGGKL